VLKSAVGSPTSRKSREVGHPAYFGVNAWKQQRYTCRVEVAHPPILKTGNPERYEEMRKGYVVVTLPRCEDLFLAGECDGTENVISG